MPVAETIMAVTQLANLAKNILSKPKKIKTDITPIQRNINSLRSQNANSQLYNQGVKNLATAVNPQIRQASENLAVQQEKSGISGTPFATRQNLQLQESGLQTTAQSAENLIAQDIARGQENMTAIERAREHITQIQQQDKIANQQAKQQWTSDLIQSGLGVVSSAVGLAQASEQQKQIQNALTTEYTSKGLQPEEIATTLAQYKNNPQLAQNVLNTKVYDKTMADNVAQNFDKISYALTPEEKTAIEGITDPVAKNREIMRKANDPNFKAKLGVVYNKALEDAQLPALQEKAKAMNISVEGRDFNQLSRAVALNDKVYDNVETLPEQYQTRFTTNMTNNKMTPLKAYQETENTMEFDKFNVISKSFTNVPNSVKQSFAKNVASGTLSASDAIKGMNEYQSNIPKPKAPDKELIKSNIAMTDATSNVKAYAESPGVNAYISRIINKKAAQGLKDAIGRISNGTASIQDANKTLQKITSRIDYETNAIKSNPSYYSIGMSGQSVLNEKGAKAQTQLGSLISLRDGIKQYITAYKSAVAQPESLSNLVEGL